MRFVLVCDDGHLDDVPWHLWAHSGARHRDQSQCGHAHLRFESRSDLGSGLDSLSVRCSACQASRSLRDLTNKETPRRLGWTCWGRQPWQSREDARACNETPVVVQRGASNVYFPVVVSALHIPPNSDWRTMNDPATRMATNKFFQGLVEDPEHPLRDALIDDLARRYSLGRDQVEAAVADARNQRTADRGIDDIRPDEWSAICQPRTEFDPRDGFIARLTPFPSDGSDPDPVSRGLAGRIAAVTLVDRLREVRVLDGFQRHNATSTVRSNLGHPPAFLPAVEVYGEGVFLRFDENTVADWERQPEAQERARRLAARRRSATGLGWLPDPTPRRLMLHTLAHLLLRQTAFDAGYSTSSLRERLYVGRADTPRPMAGVLLYTAAGDAEGTLGGLVRLGRAERLVPLLRAAVAAAAWCSFDPVCGEASGQGPRGMSLAACHACVLVPETSCEHGNRLLDRRMLVDPGFGFFRDLVADGRSAPGEISW